MDKQQEHQLELRREQYDGYLALQHNACWQWLMQEMALKREYLAQRLFAAADWPEFCALRGRLELLDSLLMQIAAIADFGKEEQYDI